MIMKKEFIQLSKVLGEMRGLVENNGCIDKVFFDLVVDMEYVTHIYETRKGKSFIAYWAFTRVITVVSSNFKEFKESFFDIKDWHCYEISYNCDSEIFVIEEFTFNK